jgi:hypothetical protein
MAKPGGLDGIADEPLLVTDSLSRPRPGTFLRKDDVELDLARDQVHVAREALQRAGSEVRVSDEVADLNRKGIDLQR